MHDTDIQGVAGGMMADIAMLRAEPWRTKRLDHLELSVRTANCLKYAGFVTVGDLAAAKEADLLLIPNFGRKSLDEVNDILEAYECTPDMRLRRARADVKRIQDRILEMKRELHLAALRLENEEKAEVARHWQ